MLTQEQFERGREIRDRIIGDRFAVALSRLPEGDIRKTFTDFVDEFCFGWVWTREAIGLKERSMLTLAVLATQARKEEFQIHTKGALNNGCSPQEIYEIALHVTVYAGVPAGAAALRWAREVIEPPTDVPSKI